MHNCTQKTKCIASGVAKGFSGVKTHHWLRETDIFNVEMLHFSFITKITTFNITLNKYQTFNINPKHPSKIPDYPNASGKF